MKELKPCPFCGGEEIKVESYAMQGDGYSEHIDSSCGCVSCGIIAREETEEEAIEAWNRRA